MADATLPTLDVNGLRISASITRPTAIICIGQNCAAHAAESGDEPPTNPIVFLKHPNTLRGANDDVRIPFRALRTDWEVELAVVVDAEARYLQSEEQSLACIGGHAVSNDVSERESQTIPAGWPWQDAWTRLFTRSFGPPPALTT